MEPPVGNHCLRTTTFPISLKTLNRSAVICKGVNGSKRLTNHEQRSSSVLSKQLTDPSSIRTLKTFAYYTRLRRSVKISPLRFIKYTLLNLLLIESYSELYTQGLLQYFCHRSPLLVITEAPVALTTREIYSH